MNELFIVIPAIKKTVAFPDDLVKKLAGIPLIQRAIAIAVATVSRSHILVVTDSEEIELICQRQEVHSHRDSSINLPMVPSVVWEIAPYIQQFTSDWQDLLILSPYAPLLHKTLLKSAYDHYQKCAAELLVPVARIQAELFSPWPQPLPNWSHFRQEKELIIESTAFAIVSRCLIKSNPDTKIQPVPYSGLLNYEGQ